MCFDRICSSVVDRVAPCRVLLFHRTLGRLGGSWKTKIKIGMISNDVVNGLSFMRNVGVYDNICMYMIIASFRGKGLARRCSRYAV